MEFHFEVFDGKSSDDFVPLQKENCSSNSGVEPIPITVDFTNNIDDNYNILDKEKKKTGRKKLEKGKECRKRKREPNNWEKNKRKILKIQGKPYVTIKGRRISEKSLKDACSCKNKCYEKFSDEKRQDIFREFYNLS
ncbi:hypothetical protein ABEB36_013748 [Hypothenemus hampei]|uniref:Uncharacterized protein n=1 Tax=Hypothenemus hampei TaxID=57062 RepID=A0ABD1E557_HYPHA